MSKFIITGTGRSGTSYVQAILRICGLNVTHQAINFDNKGKYDFGGTDGDVSFMAVPYLAKFKDTNIIWVSRNSEDVINSMVRRQWFEPNDNGINKFVDLVGTPREQAEQYITYWYLMAEKHITHHWKIIDDPLQLFKFIGHEDKFDRHLVNMVRKDANTLKGLYD